jgi:thermitase
MLSLSDRQKYRLSRVLSRAAAQAALLIALLLLSIASFAQNYAKGRILVKFRDSVTTVQANTALGKVRARGALRLGHLPVHAIFLPSDENETDAVATLRARPEVEFAEVDARLMPAATPNDPLYPNQWHLPNISAPQAWDLTVGNPNLIVAILDSGCNPTHPDLVPNYVPGWNFYDNNSDTHDVFGHGTAVAGCVGAAGNNGIGIASVSFVSKIMPCRVTDTSGTAYSSTITSALQWAADHGARIANLSFQGIPGSSAVISAAQYFYDKGGLVVCASGNSGSDLGYAASPYLIVVSGTDQNNNLASFSSFGADVTVSAPAVNIYTTTSGGGYGGGSGTSFASPVACGVLALAWSANPYLTNAQLQTVLQQSADDLGTTGWDKYFGYGKVNAYQAALQAQSIVVDTTPPTCSITSPSGGATVSGTTTVSVSAGDNVGVSRVELYVDNRLNSTLNSAPYNFSWNTTSVANGSHTLAARAYDAAGNLGVSTSVTVTVSNTTATDTTPPTCTIISPASNTQVSGTITVSVSAGDDVGVVKVQLYLDGKLAGTDTSSPWYFSQNTRKWKSGSHTLQAFAFDAAGNKGSSNIVTVTK